MIEEPPSTRRFSASAMEPADLWSAYRDRAPCPCGQPSHRLSLSVNVQPRTYSLQCTACTWQSGWFRM